jgi:hypothetical protein
MRLRRLGIRGVRGKPTLKRTTMILFNKLIRVDLVLLVAVVLLFVSTN